jgi:NADH-quinone oxidoreductase subunit L
MTVGLGASAYAAAILHLGTHAFFKALLFLAAGSVIIALHHEQDMRKMGGLRKYMPITWITCLIGSIALIGFPGFSGFYSKDAIIEAVHHSDIPGAGFAYVCVLTGVFVTALYSFRLYFMVFHGKERMDEESRSHIHETPAVVTVPLILLAIPSVVIGWFYVGPMLFGGHFGDSILVLSENDVLAELGKDYHGVFAFTLHGFMAWPFILAMGGVATAWLLYMARPELPARIAKRFALAYGILMRKYGFDEFNEIFFAGGARGIGGLLWRIGDATVIDGIMVNGSARLVGWGSSIIRHLQSGYLFHYAFAMIIGLLVLIGVFVTFSGLG